MTGWESEAIHVKGVPCRSSRFPSRSMSTHGWAREYFEGYPPSSPSFALLKDGEIKMMVERHEIEGHEPIEVVQKLEKAFDDYCN